LLVYDTTDTDSFAKVKSWVKELRKMVGESIVIVIAGNKIDLDRERQVRPGVKIETQETINPLFTSFCLESNSMDEARSHPLRTTIDSASVREAKIMQMLVLSCAVYPNCLPFFHPRSFMLRLSGEQGRGGGIRGERRGPSLPDVCQEWKGH
jgi:hypothetical protein